MGARLNWLAVQGVDRVALLAGLGLVETGVASDEADSPLACAEFPGGWLVLVSSDMGLDLDRALPVASAGGLALGCEVEEHVMVSRLRAFRGGAPAWAVTHDPDVDLRDVAVEGEPPPPFADIRAALAAQQAEGDDEAVDYMFDLPSRLGQDLCGYIYNDLHPVVWTILERARRTRAGETATQPLQPQLPQAFTSAILPLLTARGWSLSAQDAEFRGRAWDVTRVVDGRREVLGFLWKENGPELQFEANFVVLSGTGPTSEVLRAGETCPVRPAGAPSSGQSLWRRIADRFHTGSADPPPPPPDPLAQLISRVKDDLTAIEAFLSTGEPNPRIRVNRGSFN
jgi:hypothetical protein